LHRLTKISNVKILKSVDEIGKDSIASLSGDGFYIYEWLKIAEKTQLYKFDHPFKLDPFYVAVFDRDELVALAPCFLRSNDHHPSWKPNWFLKDKIYALSSLVKLPLDRAMLCNSLLCFQSRVLIAKSYDGRSALNQISQVFDSICHKNRMLFSSFLSVSEYDRLLISSLEELGYQKFPHGMCSYLDIKWKSFDEYLERRHGSNQGSGHSIRREIRKCEENGVKIDMVSEFGELADTLSHLYANLIWKYYKQNSLYDAAFYRRLNEFAHDKIKLFVARKNGEVVGFSCCFQQGETLDVHHCGFNYRALGKKDYTYFNLCYYAPIKWSIEKGIKKICYGSTLPDLKRRRGCKPERIFSFIKLQNSMLRNLAGALYAWIQRYPIARLL
jgi:predicted N-acyltransferase